jgi:outer membrane protein assembly factor BamB
MDGTLPDGGNDYNHCLAGTTRGVDPDTGALPSIQISDQSSSSPVVLPDGSVLYAGYTYYNNSRGHLVKFDATGKLVATYDDGWDQTPAVWANANRYSIIINDNHFANWSNSLVGPYDITEVDASLQKQWNYTATNSDSCQRDASGALSCTSDHPQGFEWCANAAAVDENGTVYVNSEDGRVYALLQGGSVAQSRFLTQSLGVAYTPITVDGQGRTYTMNAGVLTVVGK